MARSPLPTDEEERLDALNALCLLDTEPEERFDRITRLARRTLGAPIAVISLMDSHRQWFKSREGIPLPEVPREMSLCNRVLLGRETVVVDDTNLDPDFATNPMVVAGPEVRFYVGRPLNTLEGFPVGTLCVADTVPRQLSLEEREVFEDLAWLAEREINSMRVSEIQAEAAKAQEELRNFFSISLDLLCIASFDGVFRKLNPAWSEVLGYELDELVGQPFINFVHPDDVEKTVAEASSMTEGSRSISFDNRYRCKDGSYRTLMWSGAPDIESELFYAVARDITQIRATEKRLRKAMEMSEVASRAKSRFLANMSHEFRTPLNSVIGFSSVLSRDAKDTLSPPEHSYLDRIRANGEHLLHLVNDILDLSKIEAGRVEINLEKVSLQSLIQEVAEQLEVQAHDKDIELEVDLPHVVDVCETDPKRLRQVLINLVGNGVKFTDEGSVTIRLVVDDKTPTRIEITDTGVGIPPEKLETVFEAFRQVDSTIARTHGGTGLGLTISKSLCDLMGYELELQSQPGRGTTFLVHLEANSGREAQMQARA